jgi:hypothetical protein
VRTRSASYLCTPRATVVLFASVICFLTSTSFASADPILTAGPAGGNPAENLLFNNGNLKLGPANLIQGVTNTTNTVLDISSNVNLVGNGGQARVEGAGGAAFGSGGVTLAPHTANDLPGGLLPMGGFAELKFNIDATADGDVSFQVFTKLGGAVPFLFGPEDLDQSGQNFFRIETPAGDYITKVIITSAGNIIDRIEQIRLGGVVTPGGGPAPDVFVPEPTSLLAWGCIGLGMAGAAWRRRNRKSVA